MSHKIKVRFKIFPLELKGPCSAEKKMSAANGKSKEGVLQHPLKPRPSYPLGHRGTYG